MISRRTLIGTVAIAALACALPTSARPLFDRRRLPIGINLYMLSAAYRKDIDATLKAVADIGYAEVETNFDTYSPEATKAALVRAGLRCSAIGLLPQPLRGGLSLATDTKTLASAVKMVGADYVTCNLFPLPPGVEMRPRSGENVEAMLARVAGSITTDHWKHTADYLNAKGAEFHRRGVKFAYHNHNVELAPHGETNGLTILLENTDPDFVDFHMDVGWVVAAGCDPVALLRAYPGRFRLMHVKDIGPSNQPNTVMKAVTTEVGSGIVDWKRVLTAAVASGVRHFAVEQEPPYITPEIESARKSFQFLNRIQV